MAIVATHQWTGTRGTVLRQLRDWDEELSFSRQASSISSEMDFTPVIVARAWDWFRKFFPEDARTGEVTVKLVVELWLDS